MILDNYVIIPMKQWSFPSGLSCPRSEKRDGSTDYIGHCLCNLMELILDKSHFVTSPLYGSLDTLSKALYITYWTASSYSAHRTLQKADKSHPKDVDCNLMTKGRCTAIHTGVSVRSFCILECKQSGNDLILIPTRRSGEMVDLN